MLGTAIEQVEYVSVERVIPMRRVWAMPSSNTFDVPPIKALVKRYLYQARVSVDLFARNKRWATHTNDLNPNTAAEYHLDVLDFLRVLAEQGVIADLVIFDPPYSSRQIKECYDGIGIAMPYQRTLGWGSERDAIDRILSVNGVVVSCGWSSVGMGTERGYSIEEVLLVSHGKVHNDTIVIVERKIESAQAGLFSDEKIGLPRSQRNRKRQEEKERRESLLSQKEYERLFPKLRVQAKNRLRRRSIGFV